MFGGRREGCGWCVPRCTPRDAGCDVLVHASYWFQGERVPCDGVGLLDAKSYCASHINTDCQLRPVACLAKLVFSSRCCCVDFCRPSSSARQQQEALLPLQLLICPRSCKPCVSSCRTSRQRVQQQK
jgi:hypothetical protein